MRSANREEVGEDIGLFLGAALTPNDVIAIAAKPLIRLALIGECLIVERWRHRSNSLLRLGVFPSNIGWYVVARRARPVVLSLGDKEVASAACTGSGWRLGLPALQLPIGCRIASVAPATENRGEAEQQAWECQSHRVLQIAKICGDRVDHASPHAAVPGGGLAHIDPHASDGASHRVSAG